MKVSRIRGLLTAGLLGALLAALPARAQVSAHSLFESANEKLAHGDYMGAVPDLRQLVDMLGDSTTDRTVAVMEGVYFKLGVAHFFSGQFAESEAVFDAYLRKYRNGRYAAKAALYSADALRFRGRLRDAAAAYQAALKRYAFNRLLECDVYAGLARCRLAADDWAAAVEPLQAVYRLAPDLMRRNWAATLLTTAYLKRMELEKIYPLVPYLLRPDSFASRSVAYNVAALEAGDLLYADDLYRDALWIYRLVYPHDVLTGRSREYLARLESLADRLKRSAGDPRRLMRVQESIGELEAELEALNAIDNYDIELQTRIARSYMELRRYREGRELFLYLYEAAPAAVAEESLYLAFVCSTQIEPLDEAFEIGNRYMEAYPAGAFFDPLTLTMGQLYARLEAWPALIEHLTRTLDIAPRHESGAECLLLLGYAHFMEEQFADAAHRLRTLLTAYPGSDLAGEAHYWLGMALLFDERYEDAAGAFDTVLAQYPESRYAESAAFRRAVCDYGESRFEAADRRLAAFLEARPGSRVAGEALMMRGDIAGALGRLDPATAFYRQAMDDPNLNIELYNHSAFQCGRILYETGQYDALRRHFAAYLKQRREGANIPQAVYWIGAALWNSGEQAGALRYYSAAVAKYGGDRGALGIDMILDEWVGRTRSAEPAAAAAAWAELRERLEAAKRRDDRVQILRLKRVMLYDPDRSEAARARLTDELLREDNLPYAGPAVLETMLDRALARGREDFAATVAAYTLETFPETDTALEARMLLGRRAAAGAEAASDHAERQALYDAAIAHLETVRSVHATRPEAAEALMLLGDVYRRLRRFDEADARYRAVLGVRAWRTHWPAALYGRGECARERGNPLEAAAYYERIYLLYGHYTAWAARAYLRRAECLRALYQNAKAREVLQEMLADRELAALPEADHARALLKELDG
ncbi:MAG: tetratricopeptide repeat protein [Lentisphaerae bacterium]|nr:tetratricopeptide repeat protein [Lentisphaerota bacterium]